MQLFAMKIKDLKYPLLFAAILVASFSVTWLFLNMPSEEVYSVSNGMLTYANRPLLEYQSEVWNETADKVIYKVWFDSHGNVTVYGLLAIPKIDGPIPAFFILPGATVTKEGEQRSLGDELNRMGYATLSLDQRGHGETKESGGYLISFGDDYNLWSSGIESSHHMAVYDALRAFDLLYQLPGIDRSRIYAAGESMGGNYAMIAAGIEPRISGLLLISASGYKFEPQSDPKAAEYLRSIVGDTYIGLLSPRPLLMLHDESDTTIPLEHALDTFDKAGQPKTFLTVNNGTHSYSPVMRDILHQGLEGW
jgi:dienelactone hydrolase